MRITYSLFVFTASFGLLHPVWHSLLSAEGAQPSFLGLPLYFSANLSLQNCIEGPFQQVTSSTLNTETLKCIHVTTRVLLRLNQDVWRYNSVFAQQLCLTLRFQSLLSAVREWGVWYGNLNEPLAAALTFLLILVLVTLRLKFIHQNVVTLISSYYYKVGWSFGQQP